MRSGRQYLISLVTLLFVLTVAPAVFGQSNKNKKKRARGTSSLTAVVIDQGARPVAGAQVVVTPPGKQSEPILLTTGADGRFEFSSRGSGSYRLRISKPGFVEIETDISLRTGEPQELELRMLDQGAERRREAIIAYNAGARAFEADDRAPALAHFARAIELSPDLPDPYLGIADIQYHAGEDEAAAAAIGRYLELRPKDLQGLRLAYLIYQRTGHKDGVREVLQRSEGTPLAESLAVEIHNEGAAALQAGDWLRAEERFRAALRAAGERVEIYEGLVTALFRQGAYEQALAAADRLLALDPENVRGREVRFRSFFAQGNQVAADLALDAYIEVAPDAGLSLRYQQADMDFRAGRIEEARQALEKILEVRPEMADAHYTLGLCFSSLGRPQEARQHLERFLDLAPGHPEAATAREMLSYL